MKILFFFSFLAKVLEIQTFLILVLKLYLEYKREKIRAQDKDSVSFISNCLTIPKYTVRHK